MKSLVVCFLLFSSSIAFASASKSKVIELKVTENGFEPNAIDVEPGTSVTLKVTRETDATCATAIQIPSKNLKRDLPLNRSVSIELGKLEKGEIRFACGMDMLSGKIPVH